MNWRDYIIAQDRVERVAVEGRYEDWKEVITRMREDGYFVWQTDTEWDDQGNPVKFVFDAIKEI